MIGKEWLVPVGIAVLAAGGTWAFIALDDDKGKAGADDEEALVWVFPESPRAIDGPHQVLVLAPRGDGPSEEVPMTESGHAADLSWENGFLGFADADFVTFNCITTPCDQPTAPWILERAADDEPRFGEKDHNALRLTFYAFLEDGTVLASSAEDEDLARFELSEDFFAIPDVAWYLGEASSAPEGTRKPPTEIRSVLDDARPYLEGLPEGGVASVKTDEFAWLYGTLYVTVRIDEVVLAA